MKRKSVFSTFVAIKFTTFLVALFIQTVVAPFAMADESPTTTSVTPAAGATDFTPIVPDVTNCSIPDTSAYANDTQPVASTVPAANVQDSSNLTNSSGTAIPGLVPFDLSASRSYNLPSSANSNVMPSQNTESASTPNAGGQMPALQSAPQAAATVPAIGLPPAGSGEMQTAQEWRKAAFESLTNPNVQPMFGRTQAQMQNANAPANANASVSANGAPADNGTSGNNFSAPPANMQAQNTQQYGGGMSNPILQSQTLTAPSSNQQYGQANQKGNNNSGPSASGMAGLTRFASMFTMMGGGLMMGSMMRR